MISPHVPTLDMVEIVPDKPDNKDYIDHYQITASGVGDLSFLPASEFATYITCSVAGSIGTDCRQSLRLRSSSPHA